MANYITPTTAIDPATVRRLYHAAIKGITGLAADKVRPIWQPNPPQTPEITVDWCAYGIVSRAQNAYPYISPGATSITQILHEDDDVSVIFYGPNCEANAERLRDGAYIPNNYQMFTLSGLGLIGVSSVTHVPELINDRWFDRADVTLSFKREVRKSYNIPSLLSVSGSVSSDAETVPLAAP